MMDIKIADPQIHYRYTGQDNSFILANLEILKKSGKPFVVRVPLIPRISDTEENLEAIAVLLKKGEGCKK
jgi:pyruvate formate lyase activating enzyme